MKRTESKSVLMFSALVALVVVMIIAPLIMEALSSLKVAASM